LSPASIHSLALQGGPFGPDEVAAFEASPHAEDAVRLRRCDDVGKVAGLATPDLEHYRPALEAAARPELSRAALGPPPPAAVVPATWTLRLARARDPQGATAVALVTAAIVGAPVAAAWWRLDAAAIPFVAASILLEAVYFGLLAAAYQRAELSVVYPLARG